MSHPATPPTYQFVDGPAASRRVVVLPGSDGEPPPFTTLYEPDPAPTGGRWPNEWLYALARLPEPPTAAYRYLYTITGGHRRIVCPRCARASHHPRDYTEGYCAACHNYTSPPRYAVTRPAPGVDIPPLLLGAWHDLRRLPVQPAAGQIVGDGQWQWLTGYATDRWEQRDADGVYGQVFEVRAAT